MPRWDYLQYKDYRTGLEASAAAWFHRHARQVDADRGYVLSKHTDWRYNIIIDDVYSAVERVRPRHTMIHHGLSSQALCFNLFGPLLVRQDWRAAREAFEAAGVRWPTPSCTGRFEYDDRSVFEEQGNDQPTSWDLVLGTSTDAPSVFVEVKFVEHDLGSCSVFTRGDCAGANPATDFDLCYLHVEKNRRYWPVLKDLGLLSTAPFNGAICPFTVYYQFFREVAFAAVKGGSMVYVLDDRNPALFRQGFKGERGLVPILCRMLPHELASRVFVIPIRFVLSAIDGSGRHDDWLGEFRSKYCLQEELPNNRR